MISAARGLSPTDGKSVPDQPFPPVPPIVPHPERGLEQL